ncbi:hypothetical protein AB4Z40_34470 [Bosea sp. 2YAB26]|uniref:hypothetical protein n=1 Tax=Bosea sp. 2YAB26 TaxID=3237478 RepID=UPI003F8FA3AC
MSGNAALSKVENIAELARSFPPTRSTPEQIAGRLEERRKRIDAAKASQHSPMDHPKVMVAIRGLRAGAAIPARE